MLLNLDPSRIELMECDLANKMRLSYTEVPDLDINVIEVFSLDDLEQKRAADLCNGVTVGVGFLEALPVVPVQTNPGAVDRGPRPTAVTYKFLAVFAVPTIEACGKRHDATKLMSVAMDYIAGTPVADDQLQRCWLFGGQKSETGASTKEVVYYSQVWQIVLPVGKSS